MKELSLNKLESLEGGKFWGTDCSGAKWGSVGGGCFVRTCKKKAFWMTYATVTQMRGTCGGVR
jgi:hypothetical protein